MRFDQCIHPCNYYYKQDIRYFHQPRKFLHALFSKSHSLRVTTLLNSYHHRLILLILELHKNGSTSDELSCGWLLLCNMMFEFIHSYMLLHVSVITFLLLKSSSLCKYFINIYLMFLLLMDIWLFLAIMNKVTINILV